MTAQGGELTGDRRRLESLNSLGLSALADASVRQLETVVQRCYDYFLHQPYWRWFGQLEPILNQLGSSYNDGTACHLDLVQWATDPVWGGIKDPLVRDRLLRADAAFLGQQLAANPIRLLLLNGRSVINTVEKTYGVIFQKHPSELVSRTTKTQLVIGRGPSNIPIIGWSVNLQSSFGVTNKLKQLLAAEVGKLARSL